MPTSITLILRCQSKNLVQAPDRSPLMNISLQTVLDPGAPPSPYSALTTTVAMADDTFVFGNLYTVTVTDESPKPFHHEHGGIITIDPPITVHDAGIDCAMSPFQPGNLQISDSHGDLIVSIHPDGRVVLNANFPLDDAARAFWDAVIRLNPNANPKEKPDGQI